MVLGVILYETVDLGISAIKLTYRGLRASYYWWYDMVLAPSYVDGGSHYFSFSAGTSMAAPHVAGVAALIVEKNGGEMDPSHVERQLRASADDLGKPGNDDFYGKGRVNAYQAVM